MTLRLEQSLAVALERSPETAVARNGYAKASAEIWQAWSTMPPRHATVESTSLEQAGGKSVVTKSSSVCVAHGDRVEQRKLRVAYANHESIPVSSGWPRGSGM